MTTPHLPKYLTFLFKITALFNLLFTKNTRVQEYKLFAFVVTY